MKMLKITISALLLMIFLVASGADKKKAIPKKVPSRGVASYYADRLHGHFMSNGQRYHRDSMTCAHLKYPLGTLLKVRNPMNGKEVVVKVTDRGPYTRRFIIDLSRAAAKALGLLNSGFTQVEITLYRPGTVPFKPEDKDLVEEIPELDLEYQQIATYPHPLWEQADTIETQVDRKPSGSSHSKGNAGSKH